MKSPILFFAHLLFLAIAFTSLQAQEGKTTGRNEGENKTDAAVPENNAMVAPPDVEGLPRVLLLGDSISIGYTLDVRNLLKGKANVHRAPVNCQSSKTGVAGTHAESKWLGEGKWDVIHFNFGIWDTKINPTTGVPFTSDEEYVKNLTTIIENLKPTGAKLILATSTPIPPVLLAEVKGEPLPPKTRVFEDIPKKNELAVNLAKSQGIAVDDLYAVIYPDREKYWRNADLHFSAQGSKVLAEAVAESIEKALGSK